MKRIRAAYGNEITEHEVVKETDKKITYKTTWFGKPKEVTENKISRYSSWHDSVEDAKNYLIDKEHKKIEMHKRQIANAEEEIEKIKLLKLTKINN